MNWNVLYASAGSNVHIQPAAGSLVLSGAAPAVNGVTLPTQNLVQNSPTSIFLNNFGPAAYWWADPTTLPAGMTLDPIAGVISGTPTGAVTGSITALSFSTVGEGDFYARSHGASVAAAYGLDDNQVFTGYTDPPTGAKYFPAGSGATRGFLDTNTPGGYGQSLRFDVPGGVADGANISGQFSAQSAPWGFNNHSFGENSTFWFQYRVFLSTNWITNWNNFWSTTASGFKISNLHMDNATATSIELTTGTVFNFGPETNSQSGDIGFGSDLTDPTLRYAQDASQLIHSGWDLSTGPSFTNEPGSVVDAYPGPFVQWPVGVWLTVHQKMKIGTLWPTYSASNPQDGTYELWLQGPGLTVTHVTTGANVVVTVSSNDPFGLSGNPFAVGMPITIAGTVGFANLNGKTGTITAVGGSAGAWTATTTLTANGMYESGGIALYRRKFIGIQLGYSFDSSTSDGFNGFYFSPFMTGLSSAAPTTASMYIDEPVASAAEIPMPVGP